MMVAVKLFAQAQEIAGTEELELEIPAGATISELKTALVGRFPELGRLADQLLFAVGQEYADGKTPIPENAEIACFPPVSGG